MKKIKQILLSDEKKKTKTIDSEVNPVWNEVSTLLSVQNICPWESCIAKRRLETLEIVTTLIVCV